MASVDRSPPVAKFQAKFYLKFFERCFDRFFDRIFDKNKGILHFLKSEQEQTTPLLYTLNRFGHPIPWYTILWTGFQLPYLSWYYTSMCHVVWRHTIGFEKPFWWMRYSREIYGNFQMFPKINKDTLKRLRRNFTNIYSFRIIYVTFIRG